MSRADPMKKIPHISDHAEARAGKSIPNHLIIFTFARADWPESHAVQEPVANDQRVKQDSTEVGEKGQEQEIGEKGVRFTQHKIESGICRENWRQMQWAEHNDGIVAR